MSDIDGILNFSKPLGWTSHDAVAFVRRCIGQRRVGHAGTLDPAAAGVLPILLGRATRLADRVAEGSKLYAADVRLGVSTDTCDAEGQIEATYSGEPPSLSVVVAALGRLQGSLEQVPPAYSALKLGGEPAYARARRGEVVQLAARSIVLYGWAVVGWEWPLLSVVIHCSKGTYIRALARDLGTQLGCGAYLDALVRLRVGPFGLGDAIGPGMLDRAASDGSVRHLVQPPDAAVAELEALLLGTEDTAHFRHGRPIRAADAHAAAARAYSFDGRFLGLARGAGDRWQPMLLLASEDAND